MVEPLPMNNMDILMASPLRWVLITGCSTGIGRALVYSLRKRGWGVVATARKADVLSDLEPGKDLRLLSLDVRDEASIDACAAACSDLRLVALVNNAGYGQMGPLEMIRMQELRDQFETNVMGLQAVTNVILPIIRKNAKKGEGRIVHLASVLGRLSIPMAGAYNASKHAVVALAETLRLEIGHEIPVILVEPGAIRTEFRHTLVKAWGDLPERVKGTPYADTVQKYREQRERFAQAHGMSAEACAEKIAKAMSKRNPPRRLVVGPDAFWALKAKAIVPTFFWEWALKKMYGLG